MTHVEAAKHSNCALAVRYDGAANTCIIWSAEKNVVMIQYDDRGELWSEVLTPTWLGQYKDWEPVRETLTDKIVQVVVDFWRWITKTKQEDGDEGCQ